MEELTKSSQESKSWWNFFVSTYNEYKAKDKLQKLRSDIEAMKEERMKLDLELLETTEHLRKISADVSHLKSGKVIRSSFH